MKLQTTEFSGRTTINFIKIVIFIRDGNRYLEENQNRGQSIVDTNMGNPYDIPLENRVMIILGLLLDNN
jgi:hypothetical protein